MKVAIITPYYKESRAMLERCLQSVRLQDMAVTHFVIADGYPQDWIDAVGVRHLRLDRAHADFGNTPRSVGGILAASEGYDAIGFIDADNWLEPDHASSCLQAAEAADTDIDYVVAQRRLCRIDGSVIPVMTSDDQDGSHVDTNCFFLLPGSFHTLGRWGVMPKPLSIVGDRIYNNSLHAGGLSHVRNARVTVNYLCTWEVVFKAVRETPPDYAKSTIELTPTLQWWASLDERDRQIVDRLAGAPVHFPALPESARASPQGLKPAAALFGPWKHLRPARIVV